MTKFFQDNFSLTVYRIHRVLRPKQLSTKAMTYKLGPDGKVLSPSYTTTDLLKLPDNYKLERDGEESKVDAEMAVAAKPKKKSKAESKQNKNASDFPSRAYAVGDVLAAKKAFFAADTEPFNGKLPRLGKITSMRIHKPTGAFAYYIRWLDFKNVKGKPTGINSIQCR